MRTWVVDEGSAESTSALRCIQPGCQETPTRGPMLLRSSGKTLVAPVCPKTASRVALGVCGKGNSSYSYRAPRLTVSRELTRQSSCTKPAHSCVSKLVVCWPKLWLNERKQKSCTFDVI